MELKITENVHSFDSKTICLNMIVKNESNIITRLFDSLVSIIDCYCICDTGSTDNTIELIKDYFDKRGIPGKIIEEPFKNFAHNRTFALKQAAFMSEFVLLVDADMIVDMRTFTKEMLTSQDAYSILQGSNSFYYNNTRILRNDGKCEYIGVTHEYIDIPSYYSKANLPKDVIFIYDIGDGGSKENKFTRDEMLLLDGIKNEPNNARYHFYLANTYYDSQKYSEAIPYYLKRIAFGGWKEEVWYSYYKLGLCYQHLHDMTNAVYQWMEGFQFYPDRLEGLYEMLVHYRITSKYKLFEMIYNMAKPILDKNINRDNCLFFHKDVYSYKIYNEYTIVAFYLGITDVRREAMYVINNCDNRQTIEKLFSNLKFYKHDIDIGNIFNSDGEYLLDCNVTTKEEFDINGEKIMFNSSSSSLVLFKGMYVVNTRYVNYTIGDKGQYYGCDKHIISQNKWSRYYIRNGFLNEDENGVIPLTYTNKKYIGIEDIKLFNYNDELLFIGTVQKVDGTLGIASGKYDYNNELTYTELTQHFNKTTCEKNWVYVTIKNELCIIYS